jgi:tetratricopeptide (TPR) repeat protein
MAKKQDQNEELIVDVEEVYSKTETFIEENKNALIGVVTAIAVVVGGFFAYKSFVLKPMQEEAQQEMFMAEKYFAKDSLNLAINGDGNYLGFLAIADEYSGTKAGNLANYYLGISFLRTGQFEAAISALKDFDKEDEIVGTIAIGAIGDAYMELGDLKQAVDYYSKAANRNQNDFTTPIYLMKAGKTYELIGEYANAVESYKAIKKEYKNSAEGSEIDKYIARAESYVQ